VQCANHSPLITFILTPRVDAHMTWQVECTREYLRARLHSYYAECRRSSEPPGCLLTSTVRADGAGQLKLRWEKDGTKKQAAPRPWTVELFLRGIPVPRGYDASHLCGRGLAGCVDIEHIVVELHATNLDRKDCHRTTTCPCCDATHRVRSVCPHTPTCL